MGDALPAPVATSTVSRAHDGAELLTDGASGHGIDIAEEAGVGRSCRLREFDDARQRINEGSAVTPLPGT